MDKNPRSGVIVTEDDSQYYAVVTTLGKEKIAQALKDGTPLQLKKIAVGDANGSPIVPDREATRLIHEVWRGDCVTFLDPLNPNVIIAKTNIPVDVGGWDVYEIAVMDGDDNIIIHANAPGWRKLTVVNGTSNPMEISARVAVIDAAAIELNISYDGVNVTFKDLEAHIKDPHAHPHFDDPVPHVSEDERKYWSGFANTGPMTTEDTDFVITPALNITSELFSLTVKTPKAFVEGDTITVNEISYTLYQGSDPASDDAFNAGEVITLNFDTVSRRCWASSGGTGTPKPLPPQISNLKGTVPEGETLQIIWTWENPEDENFEGMILVGKKGSAPNSPTDGTQLYKGTSNTFTQTEGVEWNNTYYARGFAYNSQNAYQMDATGAIASVTPSNVPDQVTNFTLTPNKSKAILNWENPTGQSYSVTKVIQKIGGDPQTPEDGTEVYSGTGTTTTVTNLQDGTDYHFALFALSADGKYKPPVVKTYTPEIWPKYTYTGQHQLIKESGENWQIKFLTSGILTWNSDDATIDAFLCGGGGGGSQGGGGGGYTKTVSKLTVSKGSTTQITIGAGGTGGKSGRNGGSSSFGSQTVNGGNAANGDTGGNGGSGGGSAGFVYSYRGGPGGSNGGNGGDGGGYPEKLPGGTGQGSSTRVFGNGDYCSGGGGGGASDKSQSTAGQGGAGGTGTPLLASHGTGGSFTDSTQTTREFNPGYAGGGYGGGGGGGASGGAGAQGIVVIRNAR